MPQYLIKQRQGWYATLEIPKALRRKLKKVRFKETLQTQSLKVAEVRKHALIAVWKAEIEAARGNLEAIDKLYLARHHQEKAMRKAGKPVLTPAAVDYVMTVAGPCSTLSEEEKEELRLISSGKKFPLTVHIPDYEKSLTYVEAKTRDMRVSDLKRFTKRFPSAQSATKKEVREWVEQELILEQGLSVATCKRIMTACRGFWAFLVNKKSLDLPQPFDAVVPPQNKVKTVKSMMADKRKQFDPADYKRLLEAAESKNDTQLCSLIKLVAHTGARVEELCQVTTANVTHDRLKIEDSKTPSGWREVPLHRSIVDLVATMKSESTDGYLLSGLSGKHKYNKRSDAIGKRFSKLKTKLGYSGQYVLHSFRKSVLDQLEGAGVPENVSARIVGHEIRTMSYGLYSSGGVPFSVKQDAINKLKW